MNNYCRDAKNYLINVESTDINEIRQFIDSFNDKLENYSTNGLSCYLLGCVELCLELCGIINYKKGEAKTKLLKGNSLFLGGQYELALNCYLKSLSLLDVNDIYYGEVCSKCALTYIYIGKVLHSLKLIQLLIDNNHFNKINNVLSTLLKYRDEKQLSFYLLKRENYGDDFNIFYRIESLVENNYLDKAGNLLHRVFEKEIVVTNFQLAYAKSLEILIALKKGLPVKHLELTDILENLSSRNSFFHYIYGQINIAEIYLLLGEYDKSITLLKKVILSKKNLAVLDCRIYNLLETNSLKKGDFKGAHKYSQEVINIIKNASNYEIDKFLRDISSFLYSEECFVS